MKNKTDILIIGGGVIGLACAYYLLKEGRSVQIIERDTIGDSASGGNCGFIFSSHILPLCAPGDIKSELYRLLSGKSQLIIKPGLDISRFVWLLNFAGKCNPVHLAYAIKAREEILRHSKILYGELFSCESFECDRQQKGILLVFKTSQELEKYSHTSMRLEQYNLKSEQLNRDAVLKLEPSLSNEVCGGWYYKTDFHLHPKKLLQGWKKAVMREGAFIEENCKFENFIFNNKQIKSIKTSKGYYSAKEYVLSAGAWTHQISKSLKLNIPVQPAKGYSITLKSPSLFPEIPCIFYEKRVAATPWGKECRLGGIMEFSGFNPAVRTDRVNQIRAGADEYLSEPFDETVTEEWAGFRPMCYDDLPIIGRSVMYQNLVLAAGHGTTGLSMAPGTGKLVAEIIAGKKPHMDSSVFSADRF